MASEMKQGNWNIDSHCYQFPSLMPRVSPSEYFALKSRVFWFLIPRLGQVLESEVAMDNAQHWSTSMISTG